MTNKGKIPKGVMPTMTMEKPQKKQKLRNAEYFGLQERLDRLYAQSKENHKFTALLDMVTADENILLAYRNISKNKGSKTAGTDGKTIRFLSGFTDKALIAYVRKRLEHYRPQSVRRVEIPKGDTGKTRPLGIPTIADRLIQQCFLQILEPICEAKFHERSNGFRPNRSAERALAQCYAMIQKRGLHFVIDIDIKGFFDNVSHGKLLKQMWSLGLQDKRVLSIISAMLKAEVAGIGFPKRGTPQGGIISPLLSNIVLNELDWWITSQWENMPTRKIREYARSDNGVVDKNQKYEMLRKGSNLKECYIVRYADDFKIFCRKRSDAEKLFIAVKDWLKERLGLDISPEKSKIVNLKRQYSDFLGFKLKAVRKGNKSNGEAKYAVESHMSDKAVKRVKGQTREMVKRVQYPANTNEEYKAVGAYNAYVSGVHNYYRYATHISKDIRKIAFGITRTMKNRLRERLQMQGNTLPSYIAERYGKSRQIRYVSGQAMIPIGYVQTKAPLFKRREVNQYTVEGRQPIHKSLEAVNMSILHYLMRNPVQYTSVELNTNRLALYCAQHGCCAVTKQPLEIGNIHCHHKIPRKQGGNDRYANLTLVTENVHVLIHATDSEVIARYTQLLKLNAKQREKLNSLRKATGLFSI
jgi:group II intron reverse transcriptase/maturase